MSIYSVNNGVLISGEPLRFRGIEGYECPLPADEYQSLTFYEGHRLNNNEYQNEYFVRVNNSEVFRTSECGQTQVTLFATGLSGDEWLTAFGSAESESPGGGDAQVMAFCPGDAQWVELDYPNAKALKLQITDGVAYFGISVRVRTDVEDPAITFRIGSEVGP